MTVFVDASFLFALFNEDDEFYSKAQETAKELKKSLTRFLTSNIALAETINLIFRFKGPEAAKKFLRAFKKSGVEEVFVTPEIFTKGYRSLFTQKSKRGLNLFDCLHLATMKFLGIDTILTFDKRFKKKVKVID